MTESLEGRKEFAEVTLGQWYHTSYKMLAKLMLEKQNAKPFTQSPQGVRS